MFVTSPAALEPPQRQLRCTAIVHPTSKPHPPVSGADRGRHLRVGATLRSAASLDQRRETNQKFSDGGASPSAHKRGSHATHNCRQYLDRLQTRITTALFVPQGDTEGFVPVTAHLDSRVTSTAMRSRYLREHLCHASAAFVVAFLPRQLVSANSVPMCLRQTWAIPHSRLTFARAGFR